MDNRGICYPYRENVNLIRQFFAKPIVLICAIFAAGYAVGAFLPIFTVLISDLNVVAVSGTTITSFFAVDLPIGTLALAETAGLLVLYTKSRSRKFSTLKAPLTFLRTVSFLSSAFWAAALLLSVINTVFAALNAAESPAEYNAHDIFTEYLLICGVAVVTLCKSVFMFVWLGSAKKSVCSVYLCRKGSAACAAFSFISAALLLAIEVFAVCCENSDFAVTNAFAADVCSIPDGLNITKICVAAFAFDFLIALMAARYCSYIKKRTDIINPPAFKAEPAADETSASETLQVTRTQAETFEYEVPKDFTPRSVDFSSIDAEEQKTCTSCGTLCSVQDKFCPKCGAALTD